MSTITKERLIFLRVHQGYTHGKMAAFLGVSSTTVRRLLKKYKIDHPATEALMERQRRSREIVRLYKRGEYSCNQLVGYLGVSLKVIYTALREVGISASPAYRDRLIEKLYGEGMSISDLATLFGVTRNVIVSYALKGVSKAAEPRYSKPGERCAICGTLYRKNELTQATCSSGCAKNVQFLSNCERYLVIRKRRSAGEFVSDIGVDFDLSAARVSAICKTDESGRNPWGGVLAAIEIIQRHSRKTWLSEYARMERRSALRLLKTKGLLDGLKARGIIL